MLTKISKWSIIQDSFRITPKIESLVVFAIADIRWKFQKDSSITFWVILLTDRQTNKLWQKHNLLGGDKNGRVHAAWHRSVVKQDLTRLLNIWIHLNIQQCWRCRRPCRSSFIASCCCCCVVYRWRRNAKSTITHLVTRCSVPGDESDCWPCSVPV